MVRDYKLTRHPELVSGSFIIRVDAETSSARRFICRDA